MGSSPHVCFADELQQEPDQEHNYNAAGNNNTKKWLLELEPSSASAHGGHSSCSSSMSISPIPRYERNMGFFQLLSRRFGLRSSDDLVQDAAAQEEDARSSSTDSYSSMGRGLAATTNTARLEQMSCASSETSSTIDIEEQQLEQQLQQQQQRKSSRTSFSRLQRRSTSSLRRAFESLSLTSRSLSCSGPSTPPLQQPAPPAAAAAMPLKSALKSASNIELHRQQQQQKQQKQHQHRVASKSTSSSSACSTSYSSSTATKASKQKPPPQRILRQPVSYTYLKGMSGLPTQRVPRNSVCCQYARR